MTLALALLCLCSLAYIAVSDLRSYRVPDHATAPLALGGLIWAYAVKDALIMHGLYALAVIATFLAIAQGYSALRHAEGLGMGDIKLAGAAALWVGAGIPLVVAIAAGGALAVTGLRIKLGWARPGDPIPFGAYLACGTAILLLSQ